MPIAVPTPVQFT